MSDLRFEWDPDKDRENQLKHGVAFDEARTTFFDDRAVEFYDDSHSDTEDRFLLLGLSAKLRILLVSHCLRERNDIIRIISARKATATERKLYPWGDA